MLTVEQKLSNHHRRLRDSGDLRRHSFGVHTGISPQIVETEYAFDGEGTYIMRNSHRDIVAGGHYTGRPMHLFYDFVPGKKSRNR